MAAEWSCLFRELIVLQDLDKILWQVQDGRTSVLQLCLISCVRRWEELAGTRGQTQVSNYCLVLKERSCETMKAVTLNAFQLLRDEATHTLWFIPASSLGLKMNVVKQIQGHVRLYLCTAATHPTIYLSIHYLSLLVHHCLSSAGLRGAGADPS